MHLNLEFGRELTVQNWFLLQSVQIPHSGSKTEEFEEFLTNVILFISLSSFWMLTNCSDSPLPLNSGTSKKAHVWLLRSLGASQENPHVFKPPLWGWCKPGELPSGNVMVSCSYRDSGLPSTLPNSAVVSSHGQTGSILSPVVNSPKSITLFSSVEIEICLEELIPARVNPIGLSLSLSMTVLVQPTQKGGLYGRL